MKLQYNSNHTIRGEYTAPRVYDGKVSYCRAYSFFAYVDGEHVNYNIGGTMHRVKVNYCEWLKHLHGNAPSGTQYGYFRVSFPDGRRLSVPLYL